MVLDVCAAITGERCLAPPNKFRLVDFVPLVVTVVFGVLVEEMSETYEDCLCAKRTLD